MIKGSIVAIVSPMREDGALDFDAYRRLIDWHVAEGTNAIVAVGTTGESPTVDPRGARRADPRRGRGGARAAFR